MSEATPEEEVTAVALPKTPHTALRIIERSLREASARRGHSGNLELAVDKSLEMLWNLVVLGHAGQDEPDDREQ